MIMPYSPKLSRRETLKWFAAMAAGLGISRYTSAGLPYNAISHGKGYGTDPNLNDPVAPWPRTMTPYQLQVIAVLADMILPGTETGPAPSTLGIPDFIDEWVSAPYPEQSNDRKIIFKGLAWADDQAKLRWSANFLTVDNQRQQEIFDSITGNTNPTQASETEFFNKIRFLVVGAYYTTKEGFRDIGYLGNVALKEYPAATDEEKKIIDNELTKLGL